MVDKRSSALCPFGMGRRHPLGYYSVARDNSTTLGAPVLKWLLGLEVEQRLAVALLFVVALYFFGVLVFGWATLLTSLVDERAEAPRWLFALLGAAVIAADTAVVRAGPPAAVVTPVSAGVVALLAAATFAVRLFVIDPRRGAAQARAEQ